MKLSNIYKNKFEKYGVDPKSLLWKTRGAAHQRFRQFWAEIDFSGKSVLDIGCGFGEFGKFLLKRYKNVDYTGIDIIPKFIDAAKKEVAGGKFEVKDYNEIDDRYGVVVASGVLNSNMRGRNLKYRQKAIKKMFSLSKNIFALNMLGGHPSPINKPESNIWYADSVEILKYCLSLTRRVILRHHYHPRDFTVFMYKIKK